MQSLQNLLLENHGSTYSAGIYYCKQYDKMELNLANRNLGFQFSSFYDSNVVGRLNYCIETECADIFYGYTNYCYSSGGTDVVRWKVEDILHGRSICQQSILYRKSLLLNHPFDTDYRILADYEFLVYSVLHNARFSAINAIISNYDTSGVSSNFHGSQKEFKRIFEKYGLSRKRFGIFTGILGTTLEFSRTHMPALFADISSVLEERYHRRDI